MDGRSLQAGGDDTTTAISQEQTLIAAIVFAVLLLLTLIYCCFCRRGSRRGKGDKIFNAELPLELGSIYPLTPEQRAAALAAMAAQDAIALAASKATKEEKARKDPKWARNGGTSMERLLSSTPLLDAQYLLALAEHGGILPPFEEVPMSAQLDEDTVWRLRCWPANSSLPALCVSMPYIGLSKAHPDPSGTQLQQLVPVLKALLHEARRDKALKHATIGVFVPYSCCLPAESPVVAEDLVAGGLENRVDWFTHPCTHALLLNGGGGGESSSYGSGGWQIVEEAAACLVKYSPNLWETASYAGGETYALLYESLRARRRPLTSPAQMRSKVAQGGVWFSCNEDLEDACKSYERGFKDAFEHFKQTVPGRVQLLFTDCGWTDADASQVAEALEYASKHCSGPSGSTDHLVVHVFDGNMFGYASAEALKAALRHSERLKLYAGTTTKSLASPRKLLLGSSGGGGSQTTSRMML